MPLKQKMKGGNKSSMHRLFVLKKLNRIGPIAHRVIEYSVIRYYVLILIVVEILLSVNIPYNITL